MRQIRRHFFQVLIQVFKAEDDKNEQKDLRAKRRFRSAWVSRWCASSLHPCILYVTGNTIARVLDLKVGGKLALTAD